MHNQELSFNKPEDLNAYFPKLSEDELKLLAKLAQAYKFWNQKINLISRNDIEHLYLRHLAHSLSIAHFINFNSEEHILDLGTGAGLPGIPLAIIYPKLKFTLLDSKLKKLKIIDTIIQDLGLNNVQTLWGRAENINLNCDRVISRGVSSLEQIYNWSQNILKNPKQPKSILCLKGGAKLKTEIQKLAKPVELYPIRKVLPTEYFLERYLVTYSG